MDEEQLFKDLGEQQPSKEGAKFAPMEGGRKVERRKEEQEEEQEEGEVREEERKEPVGEKKRLKEGYRDFQGEEENEYQNFLNTLEIPEIQLR